jgi:catechol 2,3-dioxygenase-like lactoylglutathione lyase family enzyme
MKLGRLDLCLRVSSAAKSRAFYEGLGFEHVEGNEEQGWAVVANDEVRLGLFEAKFMDDDAVSLNFRGAHIGNLSADLQAKGYKFASEPKFQEDGTGSARLRDPDGHMIFFDTGETDPR